MNTIYKVFTLTDGTKYFVIGRIPGQDLVLYETEHKNKALNLMHNYFPTMILTEEIKPYVDTRMNCCY